ncbi:enoyl-CoA hydratase/isomerase family protein [Silicimonas algicola]|uniref:Enoyl-CoA hydratase n=1 Tax=Silicimonas algicola TaxID=1826607 RepID=A0A316G190_9RHOB|nr:enoyl-CoA hydratase/isomerase family protein [Silicimonas algicola]AZQ68285.1 enoyl-CoA hydratase/isomerase family protein [Silicimonas algicola]PWK54578.1 enoyl-CoA hydratase [Silicimonas algicola]
MTDESRLIVTRDGPVASVILNRPDKRNAVDLSTCHALRSAFQELDADPTVLVVLISGAGPSFCAGADLSERKGRDAAWVRQRRLAAFAAYDAIERCGVPVVALVHGAVVGAGGEIAMAADFIIAAEGTVFRFPEPKWGTVGATQRLQRAIGIRGAKELLFTGRDLPAAEALARGLGARVVPAGDLEATGQDIAAAIAAAPALAIRLTKQAINLGGTTDLANGIRIELAAIDHNLAEGDWQKGQERFMDRKKDS